MKSNKFSVVLGLTKYALISTLRSKTTIFFSLLFPLAFVAIFGLIGSGSSSITLGVPPTLNKQNPVYQALKKISDGKDSPLTLEEGSESDLETKLTQTKLDSILDDAASPTDITLVTSNANPQGAAIARTFLNGVLSQMNLSAAHVTKPIFNLKGKELSGRTYRYIDFALPGQIGFSLIALATFGVAFSLITMRKTLVLKRLFATTVTPIMFVISQCLSRTLQGVIQAAIIIGVGVWAFQFNLSNGWVTFAEMLLISALGIISFLGFGIFLSNLAKDEQSIPVVLNLFNLPQIILSGVFFPTDTMPRWGQLIGNNLPLAYVATALRKVATEGAGFSQIWPYLLGMVAWSCLAYFLAAKTFKSE